MLQPLRQILALGPCRGLAEVEPVIRYVKEVAWLVAGSWWQDNPLSVSQAIDIHP